MLKFPVFMTTWFKQELNSYKEALEHFFLWKPPVFDPPPCMVLAIQSALYKTHKHHNDQKTACCQPLLLLDVLRGGRFIDAEVL